METGGRQHGANGGGAGIGLVGGQGAGVWPLALPTSALGG